MKFKQKVTLFSKFVCITSFACAYLLVLGPPSDAYAVGREELCSSTDIVPENWAQTRAACEEAVKNNTNPCDAIFATLEADGNEAAEEKRTACNTAMSTMPDAPECEAGAPGCCGGVKTSIIGGTFCGTGEEDGTENGPIYYILMGVLNILTAGIGIAAVGGIAYGAFLYTTAENKPEQTKRAIGIITNVVIGLLAYALMYVLLNFLIPGGIFT